MYPVCLILCCDSEENVPKTQKVFQNGTIHFRVKIEKDPWGIVEARFEKIGIKVIISCHGKNEYRKYKGQLAKFRRNGYVYTIVYEVTLFPNLWRCTLKCGGTDKFEV